MSNIKQYLFDHENANENGKIAKMKEGLTIQKVATDYLKFFVKLALERLQVHKIFSQSEYFQKDYNLGNVENIRYCLVCPKTQQIFMSDHFVEAGIIKEYEFNQHLSFVAEAEATAYHLLPLDRQVTKITPNQSYLVCGVGEISIGIAKINADTTAQIPHLEDP